MDYRALVLVFLSLFYFATAIPFVPETRFPPGSCIVDSEITVASCKELSTYQPPNTLPLIIDGNHYFYPSLEEALDKCPFDPVDIYLVGVNYVANRTLVYTQSKNLYIKGYSDDSSTSKATIVGLSRMSIANVGINAIFENITFYGCPDDSGLIDVPLF